MRQHHRTFLPTAGLCLMLALSVTPGAEASAYQGLAQHYEAIRLALLADSMTGVDEHASAMRDQLRQLLESFSAAEAGVLDSEAETTETTLEEIGAQASRLAELSDLEAARSTFFELTKPLARYRKLAGAGGTIVAYCSMVQKAWIQPEGEIGNPYLGQKMPRCGEIAGE